MITGAHSDFRIIPYTPEVESSLQEVIAGISVRWRNSFPTKLGTEELVELCMDIFDK
jgi:hypothetical protein